MSKGTLREVFAKNFSQEEVEKSRQAWVEPTIGNDKPKDDSDYLIKKICDTFDVRRYTNSVDDEVQIGLLFSDVRRQTFKMLWAQHRKVPHASHYKIVAGTVFMRLAESVNLFDEASSLLRSEWY